MHRLLSLALAGWACAGCSGASSDLTDAGEASTSDAPVPEDHGIDHTVPPDTGAGDTTPPTDGGAGDCASPDGGSPEGGSRITISPCGYTIYPAGTKQCTASSTTAASFEIYDSNADASFDLVNVDETCTAKPYGTVTSAVPVSVMTYTESAWRLDDHASGMPIGTFVLHTNQAYSVMVK